MHVSMRARTHTPLLHHCTHTNSFFITAHTHTPLVYYTHTYTPSSLHIHTPLVYHHTHTLTLSLSLSPSLSLLCPLEAVCSFWQALMRGH